ncbi:hypothetical protein SANTM175S_07065 [Streptomyces antimycoticus]
MPENRSANSANTARAAAVVGGGDPAGAQDQRDVVGLRTGQLAQAGGGVVGGGVGVALDVVPRN